MTADVGVEGLIHSLAPARGSVCRSLPQAHLRALAPLLQRVGVRASYLA
ncbi:hypothetical protein [Streptomyces sp. NPDC058011]